MMVTIIMEWMQAYILSICFGKGFWSCGEIVIHGYTDGYTDTDVALGAEGNLIVFIWRTCLAFMMFTVLVS